MNHETHYACEEQLKKLGGKAPCCECSKHLCKPTQSPAKPINTNQLSECPNCHCMTYVLMDADGNRTCGKCEKPKDAAKPGWLEKHICRFNDGENWCECYHQAYIEAHAAGEKEGIKKCVKALESVKILVPQTEPPKNGLSQNQIFASGQMNMTMRIAEALQSLLPLDTNN